MNVITRFPPSPTGYFHIGSARTALFNYLFAAHHGGVMQLRLEDTDKERGKKEYEDDIVEGLKWLGISYTKPALFRQSERTDIYRIYLKTLIEKGAAYEAEPGVGNPDKKVVRFRNPGSRITFDDLVRGEVSFDTAELKDFVIAKNVDEPLYHLAVVVDDHEMGITHVVRGEDHISNTPRQILILEALGFPRPQYAHIPLILAPDKSKLSKRHGAVSLSEYRQEGYLPQALVNYLALLGWNPGGEQELFSLEELTKEFTLEKVHSGGAVFDTEKLKWFNREYIRKMPPHEFVLYSMPTLEIGLKKRGMWSATGQRLIPIVQNSISTTDELAESIKKGEYDYFFREPALDVSRIPEKKSGREEARSHLVETRRLLAALSGEFSERSVKDTLWNYATKKGRGMVLWPLRYCLSGREKSPDPFVIASIIGKEETLKRIDAALAELDTP